MTSEEWQLNETFRRPAGGGPLVTSKNNTLGPGKAIARNGGRIIVEYFHSPGRQTREELESTSLLPVRLELQTRCFLYSETRQRWVAGRITHSDTHEYQIDLPDGRSVYVPEAAIYIRCREVADPMDTLLVQGHETAFFYKHRIGFIRNVLNQRAAFHGLTALASSRVELYPHQVEIVRRVLEDPIQRYLLADEVGLGKTIEAGVLLRQYLIDDPAGRAIVVVPPSLVSQWRVELADRFQLTEASITVTDAKGIEEASGESVGMLVVDEAHNIGAAAFSADAQERTQYAAIARLSHSVARLLLLSATPAANHEKEFLAMLHLLEPATYQLSDLSAFRERVEKRQAVGRLLLAMQEDAEPFVLKRTAARVGEVLPNDVALQQLSTELLSRLSTNQPTEIRKIVRLIRAHISESYRIHRRMLRNRRDEISGVLAPRASETESIPYVISVPDSRIGEALRWIDDWRAYASAELDLPETAHDFQLSDRQSAALEILRLLIDCAATSMSKLEKVVLRRLGEGDKRATDLAERDVNAIANAERFEGEREILQKILLVARAPKEHDDPMDALCGYLHAIRLNAGMRPPPKCVVFAADPRLASELASRIVRRLDGRSVASIFGKKTNHASELIRFEHERACFVLVCDRTAEEGLNLQFADQVVLYDLPWTPNQIEQRIGRLDRIGRKKPVRTVVFRATDDEDSIQNAWLTLLRDHLQIFHESVAGLQFFLQQQTAQLDHAMLTRGAEGIRSMLVDLKMRVASEKDRLREQSALDEIDASTEHASRFFQSMEDCDADADTMQSAFENWACTTLKILKDRTALPDVVSYSVDKNTMIPYSMARQLLGRHLRKRTTFSRAVGLKEKEVSVVRVGSGLVDGLSQYIEWDDRGSAYAIWRYEPSRPASADSDWMGFRLHFAVEANVRWHRDLLAQAGLPHDSWRALQRRADAIFPPKLYPINFDSKANEETNPEILGILKRSFSKAQTGGSDTNLHKENLALLAEIVPLDDWEWSCRNVRVRSEHALRAREEFIARISTAAAEADRIAEQEIAQLTARASSHFSHETRLSSASIAEQRVLHEVLRLAVSNPSVRLESVGFVVIAGRKPAMKGPES